MVSKYFNSKSKKIMDTKCIHKFKDTPGSSAKSPIRKPLKAVKVPYRMYILLLFALTFPTTPGDKFRVHTIGSDLGVNHSVDLSIASPVSSVFQSVQ